MKALLLASSILATVQITLSPSFTAVTGKITVTERQLQPKGNITVAGTISGTVLANEPKSNQDGSNIVIPHN